MAKKEAQITEQSADGFNLGRWGVTVAISTLALALVGSWLISTSTAVPFQAVGIQSTPEGLREVETLYMPANSLPPCRASRKQPYMQLPLRRGTHHSSPDVLFAQFHLYVRGVSIAHKSRARTSALLSHHFSRWYYCTSASGVTTS